MDFAKKILGKYGWKEGDGLGRNNDGIAKPLKASLKFDNAGLGVDRAAEFNDHWWERCFNEAANNVDVKNVDGKVCTKRKHGEEEVEISTKAYSSKKLKKARKQQADDTTGPQYNNFLQSATLTKSGDEINQTDAINSEDIAVTAVKILTDEELFNACGGRTAHKGARHGLKLSGKLARLEQQEKEMLAKLQQKAEPEVPKVKKKKKKNKDLPIEEDVIQPDLDVDAASEAPVKSKKKKKRKDQDLESSTL